MLDIKAGWSPEGCAGSCREEEEDEDVSMQDRNIARPAERTFVLHVGPHATFGEGSTTAWFL